MTLQQLTKIVLLGVLHDVEDARGVGGAGGGREQVDYWVQFREGEVGLLFIMWSEGVGVRRREEGESLLWWWVRRCGGADCTRASGIYAQAGGSLLGVWRA